MRKALNINQPSILIKAIKANDNSTLQSLYNSNYFKVETLVLKNNGSVEQAKDIFQEAFIILWKNIKQDKFVPESKSAINKYLYTIAKNKWMGYLRSNAYKKTVSQTDFPESKSSKLHIHPSTENHEFEQNLTKVMTAFEHLGEPCKSLLKAFYFDKKSMKDLAHELNMNTASVKNKKYRCMQRLRELAQNLKNN